MLCISYVVSGLILGMIVMAVVYEVSGRIGRHHCTVDMDAAPVAIVDMGQMIRDSEKDGFRNGLEMGYAAGRGGMQWADLTNAVGNLLPEGE